MIVVTGATGNVGRSLVNQLLAAGHGVRAVTRDPRRARLPDGADVTGADLTDTSRLDTLFDGATGIFLNLSALSGHTPLSGGAEHTAALLAAARTAGVTRVVLLSSGIIEEGADTTHPIHIHHAAHEQAVRDSGLPWTFLRPYAFASNAHQWAPQIRTQDTVRGPYARATTAPIHEHDIAAVAATALLDRTGAHTGAAHRLTGPEAVTTAEQIHAIGEALGRHLTFREIPAEETGPELFPHVPAQMLPAVLDAFAATVDTEPLITTTVEDVTGTRARTFARWAEDHRDDFR
ncbi:SDR family oxidoreductase [Streptomyces sp. NPDC018031]|uniref:SDR family oxidoreductase n=1 Tax=Streptomyces sp. NPDC018031 TaxID=3365033 RepID=UPI0037B8D03A